MKMKRTMLVAALLLSVLLSGCNYEAIIDSAMNELAQQMTDPEDVVEPFIGFAREEVDDTEQLRQITPLELQNYTSRYGEYNSYTYFEHLNDSEKLIYRAYEYALDEALPHFWVDDRLLQDLRYTVEEILEFLALDSAVVEQNYSYTYGGFTVTHSVFDVETASETYTTLTVENFSPEKQKRKEEAIEKARQLLSGLPESATSRETAEYFFDYLGENVTYETQVEEQEYLYGALCLGKTNCDGYTNAFALLCCLADIPCIEINSDTPENQEGHTWNAVYLENKWVHVDATGAYDDVGSENEYRRQERIHFGFSDDLLSDRVRHRNLIPACPEGLTSVVYVPSGEIEDLNGIIKRAFQENDNQCAIVLVDEGDLEDQITEELVNELDFGLFYIHFETVEGKTVYYLFHDGQ